MDCDQRLVLPPTPLSVRRGRHLVIDTVPGCGFEDLTDLAALLTSEALTNAVIHARTTLELMIRCQEDLLITVTDCDRTAILTPIASAGLDSLLNDPDLDSESGRGLVLIATLAHDWGITTHPHGKTLWFTLVPPRDDTCDIAV